MKTILYRAKPATAERRLDHVLFVGMDIHKDSHTAALTNCFGHKLMTIEIENSKDDFAELLGEVEKLSSERSLTPVFGLEDGYGNGIRLANHLAGLGFDVRTVSPVEVDRQRRKKTHPEKSDSLDALGVAKVLIEKIDSLPVYSISNTDKVSKQLRELVNDRETLVKERARLKNQLHVLLHKSYGSVYKEKFNDVFALKALRYWQKNPLPKKNESDGLIEFADVHRNQIRRKVKRLLAIHEELKQIKREIKPIVRMTGQKLETMNGCGLDTAAKVLAEVRNIERFASPAKLAKYAGLAPRKKSSGKKDKDVKDIFGNRRLNRAIHTIALSQIGRSGNRFAKEYYQRKISEGKSKSEALRCLKRQLVDIIYSMLKNRSEYNYHKAVN